jgi:NADPH:quinone reductase-like Zn-dependent oxidoreductase
MKAVRVHAYGGLDALTYEDVLRPAPGPNEALVRVAAAGVGPWDAWVREGKSVLPQPLPLVLGADLSGTIEALGPQVTGLDLGDEVYGVTNARFTGAYAEYAVAGSTMIARKPMRLSHVEAASMPVVASTAWQMLSEHAQLQAGQRVLVLGAGGNVGSYAVQLARLAGAEVIATAFAPQADYVRSLGASTVIDPRTGSLGPFAQRIDAVIDTVGGDAAVQSFETLRPGGILVSAVAVPDQELAAQRGVRAVFILVSVTTAGLVQLAGLIEAGKLRTNIGEVLPLSDARTAHQMLAGRKHRSGKIVLVPTQAD